MSPVKTTFILAIAVLAVSFAAIFVRLAEAPGIVIASFRMLLASAMLLPWTVQAFRRSTVTRSALGYSLLAGLSLAVHFATFISAIKMTSITASTTLVTTNPLWIMLFSWLFLRLSPSLSVLMGVLIAVLGTSLIALSDASSSASATSGNVLAILGAISIAAYFLLARAAQRRGLALQAYSGLAYGVAALALLPLPLVLGTPYLGYSWQAFFWILMLALIPQLIGHTSFNYALKHLSPTLVATVALLEPVVATLLGVLIFQEIPSPYVLVGAAILLLGITLVARNSQPPS